MMRLKWKGGIDTHEYGSLIFSPYEIKTDGQPDRR